MAASGAHKCPKSEKLDEAQALAKSCAGRPDFLPCDGLSICATHSHGKCFKLHWCCHLGWCHWGCSYCDRRERLEEEQLQRSQPGSCRGDPVICRELQAVGTDSWRHQQEQDPDIQPVLQWVERQLKPPWEEVAGLSLATKGLWSKFEALRLEDGVLQRAWKDPATGEERWQIVVPKGLKDVVLQAMHGASGSGHFGVTKTLRRLRQGFYWGRCRRDVEDFCRRCDPCTARKGPTGQSHALLQQFVVGAPMERVAVDVMGPLPRSDKGNCYVLSAIDYFTKWPEAYAIPDQEAETVADALLGGFISRFGVPDIIHSDQGRNFESRVFSVMCSRLGIQKTRTTPLHPQSDGLVERLHRTLGQQLAILTAEHQRDWDEHLPLVLMACRSAVQDSTACTPSLLMLGRELRTPAELSFGRPPDAPAVSAGPEYARKLQDRLETAHAFARRQQEQAGVRQKRNYDVRAKGRHFTPGELVWVYNPRRKKGRCPKLDSQWVGPCRVLERMGEVVYRVQMLQNRRKLALHRDRLAPYQGRAAPQAPEGHQSGSPVSLPASPEAIPLLRNDVPAVPSEAPQGARPQRTRRAPRRFDDFVCSLVGEELCSGGVV
ncbi:UPF0524 protein C3orf70 homolog isoform X1 [Xiphophorus maculatus]|uniref:UPF0524 protein C3orf70 homolog isoform X1 n=1 Tax=Xiphophorus maculatus TaxID=8083 RepID=UPI000C6EC800|nr:UPF0524 protein C3orf70 homolog isoform X1 [Xiphophorus maculatus]